MSHAARISTVGTGARRAALTALGLVIAFLAVVAAVVVLAGSGSGAATQSNAAQDAGPFPGLSQQAEQAGQAIPHPRSVPPVRVAPSRGSAASVPAN